MVDVSRPRVVDVRVATLCRTLANAHAEPLLKPGYTGSGYFEDQRLQFAELALPFLWIRRADAVKREEELAQESQ